MLGRDVQNAPEIYKVADGGSGKGAWGAKGKFGNREWEMLGLC